MKKLVLFLPLVFMCLITSAQSTIYGFKIDSVAGTTKIDFDNYHNKKMVIVNIASNDSLVSQLSELEQFYQIYKDSVLVIAIPSNSFNSEPLSESAIADLCSGAYHIHFPVSARVNVIGANTDSLYKWLTTKSLNSLMDATVRGAYQKFLINRDGKLVGVVSRKMRPMETAFRRVIEKL
jgi:glutathione peroxidase